MALEKTLTLTDLILFGVASILGSGGFNLVGEAIVTGGNLWPLSLATAGGVFLGASRTYEIAFKAQPSNTGESDFVTQVFGTKAGILNILAILMFNILSISTILVYCAHMLFPEGTWLGQISFSILLLMSMTYVSLQGIDVNKNIINNFMALFVAGLAIISVLGIQGVFTKGEIPSTSAPSTIHSFASSLFFFYFILAGFDALIKFTEETKESKDVPRSFYLSNGLCFFLLIGVCLAYVTWVNYAKLGNHDNAIGDIVQHFLGGNSKSVVKYIAIIYLLLTTFVTFLATSRYLYGFSEDFKTMNFLSKLNEAKAPMNAILLTGVVASFGILMNHTETLVRLSDFGLSAMLLLVSAAATKYMYDKGKMPWIEGLTTTAFAGLMGLSFF